MFQNRNRRRADEFSFSFLRTFGRAPGAMRIADWGGIGVVWISSKCWLAIALWRLWQSLQAMDADVLLVGTGLWL